jgi:predicted secreted protein
VRFGSVRYSTPPGHVDTRVWCRVVGDELVMVAMTAQGTTEIAWHLLSTPGNPRIVDAHYPDHPEGNHPRPPRPRPRTKAEAEFLDIGEGADTWRVEAAATGTTRVRSKIARAVEFAAPAQWIDSARTARHHTGRAYLNRKHARVSAQI